MSLMRSWIAAGSVALFSFGAMAPVTAQDGPFAAELEARQSQFKLLGFNIGALAGMAQGRVPYDAAVATAAADNIAAIAGLDQSRMWPAGSDNESITGTRALPVIWSDAEGFGARLAGLRQAAASTQQAAGTDLNALRGAVRELGGACAACHETYRQPQ